MNTAHGEPAALNDQVKLDFYVQFECGAEERWSEKIGPFPDFLQITYDLLRCEGDTFDIVAYFGRDGDWHIDEHYSGGDEDPYSDIIIWAEPRPE
jgi:hypothetical protein